MDYATLKVMTLSFHIHTLPLRAIWHIVTRMQLTTFLQLHWSFLLLVKSMCNVQSITHANGIVKCILKYVAKFDLANPVIVSANAHTDSTQVGSEFLQNIC